MDKSLRDSIVGILDDFLTVRSLITLGAFFTLYGMVWTAKIDSKIAVDLIKSIIDMLLGFWFGSKVATLQIKNGNGNGNGDSTNGTPK